MGIHAYITLNIQNVIIKQLHLVPTKRIGLTFVGRFIREKRPRNAISNDYSERNERFASLLLLSNM